MTVNANVKECQCQPSRPVPGFLSERTVQIGLRNESSHDRPDGIRTDISNASNRGRTRQDKITKHPAPKINSTGSLEGRCFLLFNVPLKAPERLAHPCPSRGALAGKKKVWRPQSRVGAVQLNSIYPCEGGLGCRTFLVTQVLEYRSGPSCQIRSALRSPVDSHGRQAVWQELVRGTSSLFIRMARLGSHNAGETCLLKKGASTTSLTENLVPASLMLCFCLLPRNEGMLVGSHPEVKNNSGAAERWASIQAFLKPQAMLHPQSFDGPVLPNPSAPSL